MSQRTIVEINHDVPGMVPGDQGRLYQMLMRAVESGSPEPWEPGGMYERTLQLLTGTVERVDRSFKMN